VNFGAFGGGLVDPVFVIYGSSPLYYWNCFFSNFSFNFGNSRGGLFYFNYTSAVFISESVFENLNTSSSYSIIFYSNSSSSGFILTLNDSIVRNVRNTNDSENVGIIWRSRGMSFTSVNASFVNITGVNSSGTLYIDSQTGQTFILKKASFVNITCGGKGGAIFNNDTKNFPLESCAFETCNASDGGAIFINSSGVFIYINCAFYDNNATTESGGRDIGHSSETTINYSNGNYFIETCSNSESPRIVLPDGAFADELLFGIIIYYYYQYYYYNYYFIIIMFFFFFFLIIY
jgi:hypothetical protein